MQAIVFARYGPPELLELRDVPVPEMLPGQVLVRVRASSVNPVDWHTMRGQPVLVRAGMGVSKPRRQRLGTDVAGVVEEVGEGVTAFRPGDEVFGTKGGAFVEFAATPVTQLTLKPSSISFDEAAAAPVAAVTALQGLRAGDVRAGQRVLVNGAAGGVGTFAVQLAAHFGADVTAVSSARNLEQSRSLGAGRVVDYAAEDVTDGPDRYDLILDIAGSRPWRRLRRVLAPSGAVVIVGGQVKHRAIDPIPHLIGTRIAAIGSGHRVSSLSADVTPTALAEVAELLAAGSIRSIIDRRFPLAEVSEAIRYVEAGHARTKVVITVP
jgi:NADPH:quinone reductase-like Zn-dependent oxidoreductase